MAAVPAAAAGKAAAWFFDISRLQSNHATTAIAAATTTAATATATTAAATATAAVAATAAQICRESPSSFLA
jgi:hypothetical protein